MVAVSLVLALVKEFLAAVYVETVAVDVGGADLFPGEYVLKRALYRGGPGTGGTGHDNDGVTGGHGR